MTDRKTAMTRVAEAERRRERWYQSARRAAAAASRAERKGDAQAAAGHRKREARALRLAKKQEQIVQKYTPIASMADRAARVAELGTGLKKAWDKDRAISAKRNQRAKRKPETTRVAPDPILMLTRTGHLDQGQIAAARRYREAWEACHGSLRGTLDPDRVGGGGGARSPSPRELEGAELVNRAWAILGENDSHVVHLVVGEGFTILETADRVYHGKSTRRQQEWVGVRLREALSVLAKGLKRKPAVTAPGEAPPAKAPRSPPAWMDEEAGTARKAGAPADFRRPVKPDRVAHVEPVGRRVDVTYSGPVRKKAPAR